MRLVTLTKSLEIHTSREKVFHYLADLRNQVLLHPYFDEIRIDSRFINARGETEFQYEAYEENNVLGLIPWRSKHQCSLRFDEQKGFIEFTTRNFPYVQLKALLTLQAQSSRKTLVKEALQIHSPVILHLLVSKVISETHNSLLRTLKLRLEEA